MHAKVETVQELFNFLEQVIHDGHGSAEILFDTEARKFNYHMAKIGSVSFQPELIDFFGKHSVNLYEDRDISPPEGAR